ncbi:hypothetical protein [Aeromonas veronii]|uniref:hypothetical protein n=1 Tax=Aeromonas veronii TaxID=654 RepID=UPI0039F70DE8
MDIYNKIPFAISIDTGTVVSVDEVLRGLQCNCRCPSCHGRLKAIKGSKNVHHFAHHDKSREQCEYAFETSVRTMLLSKLSELQVINTPEYIVLLEGEKVELSSRHPSIKVRFVPQVSTHDSPHGLFELVGNGKYNLGLVFPAVNEAHDFKPPWLDEFVVTHPNTGILSANYRKIGLHLFTKKRPDAMDTTDWLFVILSEENDCLRWLFHPREQDQAARERLAIKAIQQRQVREAREEEQEREKQARQQLRANRPMSKAKRKKLVYEESARRHQAWLLEDRLKREREAGIHHNSLQTPTSSAVQRNIPSSDFCKHCQLISVVLDAEGYCFRASCISARLKHTK